MKKKIVWLLLAVVVLILGFLLTNILMMSREKAQIKVKLSRLKELPLVDLDSTKVQLPVNRDLFIVYFNSTCLHCQTEIQDIKENITRFSDYTIVLISMESLAAIRGFVNQYGLRYQNLFVTKIKPEDTFDTFGSLATPHVFIYGRDSTLIKEFKGPHTVEGIFKQMK